MLDVPDPAPEEIYREIKKDMGRRNTRSGPAVAIRGGENTEAGVNEESGAGEEDDGPETGKNAGAGAGGAGSGGGGLRGPGNSAVRRVLGPLGGAISAMREKIQWEWVDHSALLKKLLGEFREGDRRLRSSERSRSRRPPRARAGCRCGRTGCPRGRCTTLPNCCDGRGETGEVIPVREWRATT